MHIGIRLKSQKEKSPQEDLGVGKKLINNILYLQEMDWSDLNLVHLAQDRDHRRAVLSTVINFGFH